jgi:undecaprenyl-diphosphatase
MELAAAALLGVVQGLTEFLPISSSAHLILVPWLLGWEPKGLAFDVSLHVGTALAVLVYFRADWIALGREAVLGLLHGAPPANRRRKLAWCLVVGVLPAAAAGLFLADRIEEKLRSPLVTVVTLIAFGLVLYHADRRGRRSRDMESVGWGDAVAIGLAQALALVPGVSRSGITISAGLLLGLDRPAATRFSFLLATPVIVGAGALEAAQLFAASAAIDWAVFGAGTVAAAVTGLLCIKYFLRYVRSGDFTPFVIYRICLALIVFVFYLRQF